MHFKSMMPHTPEAPRLCAVCSLCAQDIYCGERAWRCGGVTVCADCFVPFAHSALAAFEIILGEEEAHDAL